MLVYNIKLDQYTGRSDLIAKLKKWNSPTKQKSLVLSKTIYIKLTNDLYFYQG
jgi:hypothetical protein